MRAQLLARDFGRIGVDQDEGEHGRSRPVVDPGMHRAALHDDVAGLHVQDLAAVELEVAFARQQQRIIDGLGAVHEFGRARGEFGDANYRALASADVVVAFDEAGALRRVALLRIVDRHLVGRPDLAAGDMRPPKPADGLQPLVGLDDRLAGRVVPGDDPPYFQCHGIPPVLHLPRRRATLMHNRST
jgi:hypothetical protein